MHTRKLLLILFLLIARTILLSAVSEAQDLFAKANKLFLEKKLEQAVQLYKQAIELNPHSVHIYSNLGLALFFLGNNNEAITYFQKAITIDKQYKNPYKYLGTIFNKKRNHRKSIHYVKKALKIDPNDFDCKFLLATNLVALQELTIAEKLCKLMLEERPNDHLVLYNTAYILKLQGKFEESIQYYKKVLQLDPNMDIAHLGIAKSLLAIGELQEAWPHFEYRFAQYGTHKEKYSYQHLKLQDFVGKTIIILSEWGLGDMMHFIRYAKYLKKIGAKKIIVQAHVPLIPLFKQCDYIDMVVQKGDPCPQYDIKIPAMSLPLICNTSLKTIPAEIPYLYADTTLTNYWKKKLSHDTSFKVGICWNAKPIFIEDNKYTKRSIPLQLFAPLAKVENASFYSLQKIYGLDQLENIPEHFNVTTFEKDFDESHGRFMDTAAVIANLDLVITADTSIVHLAGAMGKKVWVLIPYIAEWRWLQHKEKSPWYPNNMRLFRQKELQNWSIVIEKVKTELQKLIQRKEKNEK